jgi:SCP-2 sterol transfer family
VARFLSAEWFAEVARSAPLEPGVPAAGSVASPPHATNPAHRSDPGRPSEPGQPNAPGPAARLILEQVVHDTPEGEVRYRVIVTDQAAQIEPAPRDANGAALAPDLIIASDWATASALAQGRLSAQAALMAGRLRVQGSLGRLSGWMSRLAGLDPVPPDVRRRTTY